MNDVVAAIIDDVRGRAMQLLSLTAKFDNLVVANVSELAVSMGELNAALDGLDKDLRAALELARSSHSQLSRKAIAAGLCLIIQPD